MGKILDFSEDTAIASDVLEALDGTGYTPEQQIAGLVLAIQRIVGENFLGWQAIDEASDALQDCEPDEGD